MRVPKFKAIQPSPRRVSEPARPSTGAAKTPIQHASGVRMATRFEKTAPGHLEIREPSHGLPRNARLVLVLSDGRRTVKDLLATVKGASAQDIALLLHKGLIEDIDALVLDGGARARHETGDALLQVGPGASAASRRKDAAAGLSYTELYDSLNALAKQQLGPIKAYRFSLQVKRAGHIDEIREMAQRFVVEVLKAKGVSAAQMVRRALGLQA